MTRAELLDLAVAKAVWDMASYRCPDAPDNTKRECVAGCPTCHGRGRLSDTGRDPLPAIISVGGCSYVVETWDDAIRYAVGDPHGLVFTLDRTHRPHVYWQTMREVTREAKSIVAANGYGRKIHISQKRCSGCNALKPVDEFHRDSGRPDRVANRCRACVKRTKRARDTPERRARNAELRRKRYAASDAYTRAVA